MINEELIKRKIPDFFEKIDTLKAWKAQRESIKALFLEHEYGKLPPKLIPSVNTEEQAVNFAGKANWQSVYFTFENNGREHTVRTELILPRARKKSPVLLYISFSPDVPNKYLPVEEIIDNGFGIFTFCYEDVTRDNNDFSSGLYALFSNDGSKLGFGKISLWAYMASACMDYLCTRDDVDKDNVAIVGHSRLGKTALLTSALDERFVLTCANDSGCCGASVSRGKTDKNETLEDITRVFPWWFSDTFLQYKECPEKLPFDQHMLLALIAPRCLMIGGAVEDVWADNEGQLLSCQLASYIWSLYGKQGLILGNSSEHLDGDVCFHLREGSHFMSRYDWNIYMKKFKSILGEKYEI